MTGVLELPSLLRTPGPIEEDRSGSLLQLSPLPAQGSSGATSWDGGTGWCKFAGATRDAAHVDAWLVKGKLGMPSHSSSDEGWTKGDDSWAPGWLGGSALPPSLIPDDHALSGIDS